MPTEKTFAYPNFGRKLRSIHKRISLNKEEIQINNKLLQEFLSFLIDIFFKNPHFDALYNKPYYGGSYYDNSKIAHPDEYDLDMVFKIPKFLKPELHTSLNHNGFIQIKVPKLNEYLKQPNALENISEQFLEDDLYLSSNKFKKWFTELVVKTLKDNNYQFKSTLGTIQVKVLKEGGPGITLQLHRGYGGKRKLFDVDLVPSISFKTWPDGFRSNKTEKNEFLVVPKPPGDLPKYWRVSCQDQEKELLKGIGPLKPVTRLLKRLRDIWGHSKISSYMIKTIILRSLETDKSVWSQSMEVVFLEMLKKYHKALEQKAIYYYWVENQNLLEDISDTILSAYCEDVRKLLKEIDRIINRKPTYRPFSVNSKWHFTSNNKRNRPLSKVLDAPQDENNNVDTQTSNLYVMIPARQSNENLKFLNQSFGVDSENATNHPGRGQKGPKKRTKRERPQRPN